MVPAVFKKLESGTSMVIRKPDLIDFDYLLIIWSFLSLVLYVSNPNSYYSLIVLIIQKLKTDVLL